MKTYRLKNNYYNGIKLYRKGVTVYKFDRDYHYSDNGDDDTFINSAIVENNPDIFELIEEPELQEEVIEGFASRIKHNLKIELRDFKLNMNDVDYEYIDTPATLILNPQKTDIEKYKKALHILGSIWFYGDFKAETPNEKELEKIMIELGYKYKSGTAVFLGNPNPKKKKEKEQYTFILHNEIIKKFRQSYCLSKMGEYSNHIPCTLIRNKGAENNHTKITITVEDSE